MTEEEIKNLADKISNGNYSAAEKLQIIKELNDNLLELSKNLSKISYAKRIDSVKKSLEN